MKSVIKMTTTVAIASFKRVTLFILISFCMSTIQIISQQKLPIAELKEFVQLCQNERLLSSMRINITTALQNVAQDLFDDLPQCGDGLWKRIANLNMSDISNICPANWSFYASPGNSVRSCGRPVAERNGESCTSVYFSSRMYEYHQVCGRAIGYQVSTTDALGLLEAGKAFPTQSMMLMLMA